jgi:hypothetical protein
LIFAKYGNLPVPRYALLIAASSAAILITGCARDGEIDATGGVSVTRSACPAVAVPSYTGDITVFDPPSSRDARAIDIVADLTNVRSTCTDSGEDVVATATFDVIGRRSNGTGARTVTLPYFATVIRAGRLVVSKRVSSVTLTFKDGDLRAAARGTASANVNRAAATLSEEVRERITRKRKAGDTDAAIDPIADPEVRAAVAKASFELLIGFQLTSDQLQYNATR